MNIQPASTNLPSSNPLAVREEKPPRTDRVAESSVAKPPAPDARPDRVTDPKEVEGAVERVSKFVAQTGAEISFSVDEESGLNVVKVIDKASKEVIRQIPSEEMVAIAAALDKLQGLFVRDKV